MAFQRAAPLAQVDADGARDAARADAQMAVEAPVLGRHHGVDEMRTGRVGVDHAAELVAAPGKDVAVPVEHRHRAARAGVDGGRDLGKLRVVITGRHRDDQDDGDTASPCQAPEDAQDEAERRRDPADRPARPLSRRCATPPHRRRAGCLGRRSCFRFRCTGRAPVRNQRSLTAGGAVCAPDLNHSSRSPISGALRACLVLPEHRHYRVDCGVRKPLPRVYDLLKKRAFAKFCAKFLQSSG